MVVKEFKRSGVAEQTLEKYQEAIEQQAIAAVLANAFNKAVNNPTKMVRYTKVGSCWLVDLRAVPMQIRRVVRLISACKDGAC